MTKEEETGRREEKNTEIYSQENCRTEKGRIDWKTALEGEKCSPPKLKKKVLLSIDNRVGISSLAAS